MVETLDVSVVVRTYTDKRWDFLVASLESVQRQRRPARELVVVVDHNPDLYRQVQERFPDALVVENDQPRGSSGAWNAGIMASGSRIVAFLDDDAEAAPDWLEQLLAPYDDEQVLGVGGAIHAHWLGGERPPWFPEEFDWVVGCTYRGLPDAVAPVRNLIGCNMSFRRSVFEEIGGFRKGMGHVGGRPIGDDETELGIRVGQRWPDGLILHQPGALVDHKVPESRARWGYFYDRCRLEGRSKALMSRLVGQERGLAAERAYVWRTLPAGVARGLADGFRGDGGGFLRAWAICSGLAVTGASYVWGAIQERVAPPQGDTSVTPIPAVDTR